MRTAIMIAVLALPSAGLAASNGYWMNATGQVARDGSGACWHNASWTPAMAIPGCEGLPSAQSAPVAPAPVLPADNDQDGVSDDVDKCPSTPHGAVVDAAGCPKKLEREVVIYLDVKFAFGKADIEGDASAEVAKVSLFMRKYPSVKVTVEGYTDDTGPADFNRTLSKQRADVVIATLRASGVDASRLSAAAYGETHPIATNETVEGRRENRRVMAYAKAELVTLEMKKTP